jgi:hypothetical protein
MSSAMTTGFVKRGSLDSGELFSLIEHKGLVARLGEELSRAANELIHDPRGFIDGLFSPADTRDQKRRRLIYVGLGGGLVLHVALLIVMVVAGWHRIMEAPKTGDTRPELVLQEWVEKPHEPKARQGETVAPKGDVEHVRGGGGQQDNTPATPGLLPRSLPTPSVVPINSPPLENPALNPVNPNIEGPAGPAPPPNATLGDPNGKAGELSGGPGTGGGLGGQDGSGVGPNSGSGGPKGGAGTRGSPDGGKIEGRGTAIGAISFNEKPPEGFVPIRWIHRPTPVITPEAQANKVSGTVLLIATFRSDGTISDIEIRNPVAFMTESAIESLKRSRFRPAAINGIPITVFKVPVRINIELTGHS